MSPEPPHVVEDCRGTLQLMSDGTVRRSAELPAVFLVDVPDGDLGVEWRDVTYNQEHDLNARLYQPRHLGAANDARLPVVAYFHGGGFCIGSGRWPCFHAWCLRLASELPAVVLSFDYSLAPEHRIPAAHEDAATALLWLRDRLVDDADAGDDVHAWLADSGADPGRLFVSGDSAGGNMTHHVATRFKAEGLSPARISGYVLLIPAFDSKTPTQSELLSAGTAVLSREVAERYSRLALPVGANKDHPMLNPLGPDSPGLEAVGGRMLVVVGGDDMLKDNQVRYVEQMKAVGNDVELVVFAGKEHGFFSRNPWSETGTEVVRAVGRFIQRDADDSHDIN
jgi:acetyl esterase/lipase